MQDYELLELVLTLAIPRRDVKPLAKALIDHFGSFAGAAYNRTLRNPIAAALTVQKIVAHVGGNVARRHVHYLNFFTTWWEF